MDNKPPRVIINNTPPELWLLASRSANSFHNLPEQPEISGFIYGEEEYESSCRRNKNGTITVTVKAIDRG